MKEYYILASKHYLYRIFYVHILSKTICGKIRSEGCFSGRDDILSIRYYIERLSVYFNLKIQSDHFGNGRSLSIEGFNIEFENEDHNI